MAPRKPKASAAGPDLTTGPQTATETPRRSTRHIEKLVQATVEVEASSDGQGQPSRGTAAKRGQPSGRARGGAVQPISRGRGGCRGHKKTVPPRSSPSYFSDTQTDQDEPDPDQHGVSDPGEDENEFIEPNYLEEQYDGSPAQGADVEEAYAGWSAGIKRKRTHSGISDGVAPASARNAAIMARLNQHGQNTPAAAPSSSSSHAKQQLHNRLQPSNRPSSQQPQQRPTSGARLQSSLSVPSRATNTQLPPPPRATSLQPQSHLVQPSSRSTSVQPTSHPSSMRHRQLLHGSSNLAPPLSYAPTATRSTSVQPPSHVTSVRPISPFPQPSHSIQSDAEVEQDADDTDIVMKDAIAPELLDDKRDHLLGSYTGDTHSTIIQATLVFNARLLTITAYPGPKAFSWVKEIWCGLMEFASPRIQLSTGIKTYISSQQSSFRTRDKTSIEAEVKSVYDLARGDVVNKVAMLLDGHVFIYEHQAARATPDVNLPYKQKRGVGRAFKHPVILFVIELVAFSRSAGGEQPWVNDLVPEAFLPSEGESRMLPIPLYAFACTLIQFALDCIHAQAEAANAATTNKVQTKRTITFTTYKIVYQMWVSRAERLFKPSDMEKQVKMDELRQEHWNQIALRHKLEVSDVGPDRDDEALPTDDEAPTANQ